MAAQETMETLSPRSAASAPCLIELKMGEAMYPLQMLLVELMVTAR
ncbi:hypothetical protein C163_15230 [Pseudomonas sp. FGI182]|nr:hypothetical protein C163_15230 [Pseudomonas sp. FGI182]